MVNSPSWLQRNREWEEIQNSTNLIVSKEAGGRKKKFRALDTECQI